MNLNLDIERTEEALKESTGSSKFITNGMVDVVIDTAYVKEVEDKENKGLSINLILKKLEDKDNPKAVTQTIYNAIVIRKKDGSINDFGKSLFNKLAVVSGIKSNKINETETKNITVGADNKPLKVEAIAELEDRVFTGKFQAEYSLYNKEVKEQIRLLTVFRTKDKASAQEIAQEKEGTEVEIGKHYSIESEKEIISRYKDGLNEEKVKEYYQNRNKKDNNTKTTNKPSNSLLDDDEDENTEI